MSLSLSLSLTLLGKLYYIREHLLSRERNLINLREPIEQRAKAVSQVDLYHAKGRYLSLSLSPDVRPTLISDDQRIFKCGGCRYFEFYADAFDNVCYTR